MTLWSMWRPNNLSIRRSVGDFGRFLRWIHLGLRDCSQWAEASQMFRSDWRYLWYRLMLFFSNKVAETRPDFFAHFKAISLWGQIWTSCWCESSMFYFEQNDWSTFETLRPVPFHSFAHAVDVLHGVFGRLRSSQLVELNFHGRTSN